MAHNKNVELNDEMMAEAAGGSGEKWRTVVGVIKGPWWVGENNWVVQTETNGEIKAHFNASLGKMLDPGTRVKCALVGMGKWEIVEFPDVN